MFTRDIIPVEILPVLLTFFLLGAYPIIYSNKNIRKCQHCTKSVAYIMRLL